MSITARRGYSAIAKSIAFLAGSHNGTFDQCNAVKQHRINIVFPPSGLKNTAFDRKGFSLRTTDNARCNGQDDELSDIFKHGRLLLTN